MAANKNISTQYHSDSKSLVMQFHWGHIWIASWDFAQSVKNELSAAITNNDIKTVVLDLHELNTISSEWLWLLLLPIKYLNEKGVVDPKVIITNPNKLVWNVLKITKLNDILDIRNESTADILATLQSEK